MNHPFLLKPRLALFVLASLPMVTSLSAANEMTLDQAQELRKEGKTAAEAIGRGDLETAGNAVNRINRQLDSVINQGGSAGEANDDIYAGGKKYPAVANVRIESFDVPIGASVVHVPVKLDKPSANTVIAYVRVYDGKGGRANPDTTKALIFRPGDPLTKTISFNVREMNEGNTVSAVQPSVPDGGERKGSGIVITAKAGAVNEPIAGGREPLTFQPSGELCYSATGETIQFDDAGGPNTFSTSLQHGRTQVGNGETGYYGTVDMNGFERTAEGLKLTSRRLDTPVKIGTPATEYPFLAVMLSGHKTTGAQFKYGSVEWVVKMPNRFGSWPALWLLPTGGWPPEIDVYEGFGYNGEWKFASDLSTNLHGGDKLQRTFTRPAQRMSMAMFGLPKTIDSDFHTYGVTVEPEWITMFVDGKETMRYANPFKGETWYPLTNVAVKAKVDSRYNEGSGAMTFRSLKVWKAE